MPPVAELGSVLGGPEPADCDGRGQKKLSRIKKHNG